MKGREHRRQEARASAEQNSASYLLFAGLNSEDSASGSKAKCESLWKLPVVES